jgi:hypothetical protein
MVAESLAHGRTNGEAKNPVVAQFAKLRTTKVTKENLETSESEPLPNRVIGPRKG